jgi:predicted PurR-regulated permease PerM
VQLGQYLSQQGSLNSILQQISSSAIVKRFVGDSSQVQQQLNTSVRNIGTEGSRILLGIVGALPNVVLQSVLAMISCFFFMVDGKKFLNWLNEKLPLDGDVRKKFYTSFQDTAISTIWATIAAASAQSSIMLVSYLLLGIPGAFLAAGATFIFAWVPLVGSTPVWLLGTLYLFINDSILKTCLMLAAGGFTGVIDNFIRPLVLKGRGDMHPLIALVAIFGGIQMFGLLGVFFGPILMSVLLSLVDVWPLVARRAAQPPEEQIIPGLVTQNIPTNLDEIKNRKKKRS